MWILRKMRLWKCEFCQEMRFWNVNFWDKLRIFTPVCIHQLWPRKNQYLSLVPQSHDPGHFLLGDLDFATSISMLFNFPDTKVRIALGVALNLFTGGALLLVRARAGIGTRTEAVLGGGRSGATAVLLLGTYHFRRGLISTQFSVGSILGWKGKVINKAFVCARLSFKIALHTASKTHTSSITVFRGKKNLDQCLVNIFEQ